MRRFNNIIKQANDMMTEIMELQLENKQYKYADEMRKNKGEVENTPNNEEITFMINFGKSMLKDKFRQEIRYNGKLKFDDDGVVNRTFDEWYDYNFDSERKSIVPTSISADRIKDLLRDGAKELYDDDYTNARMEWVRAHKEEE